MFVLRDRSNGTFLDDGNSWGPLEEARVFYSLQEAKEELDFGEEILPLELGEAVASM